MADFTLEEVLALQAEQGGAEPVAPAPPGLAPSVEAPGIAPPADAAPPGGVPGIAPSIDQGAPIPLDPASPKDFSLDQVLTFQKQEEQRQQEVNDAEVHPIEKLPSNITELLQDNPLTRAAGLIGQGVGKAGVKIASFVSGVDLEGPAGFAPTSKLEKGLEKGGEIVGEALPVARGLQAAKAVGLLGKGASGVSRLARGAAGAGAGETLLSSLGAGTAIGALQPKGVVGEVLTGLAGGGLALAAPNLARRGIQAGITAASKAFSPGEATKAGKKAVKQAGEFLVSSLGPDEARKVAVASNRLGSNIIEVGAESKKLQRAVKQLADASDDAGTAIGGAAEAGLENSVKELDRQLFRNFKAEEFISESVEEVLKKGDDASKELFKRSNARPNLVDPELNSLITTRPSLQNAFKEAQTIAADAGVEIAGDLSQGLPTRSAFFMKKALDNTIEAEFDSIKGKFSPRGVDLIQLRNTFLNKVKTLNPDFEQALKVSGDNIKIEAAGRFAKKINDNTAPKEISEFLAKATPQERASFVVEFRDNRIRAIDKTGKRGVAADKIFKNPNSLKQLKAVFPDPERFKAFEKLLRRESKRGAGLQKIERTSKRLAGENAGVLDLLSSGEILKVPGRVVKNALLQTKGINPKTAENIADIISDPSRSGELAAAVDKLSKRSLRGVKAALINAGIVTPQFVEKKLEGRNE